MLDKLISVNELRKEIDRNFDMQNLYLPVHILDVAEDMDEGIVRCKDCKAWEQYDDLNLGGCKLFPEYNKMGDWFCNFGERKEGR